MCLQRYHGLQLEEALGEHIHDYPSEQTPLVRWACKSDSIMELTQPGKVYLASRTHYVSCKLILSISYRSKRKNSQSLHFPWCLQQRKACSPIPPHDLDLLCMSHSIEGGKDLQHTYKKNWVRLRESGRQFRPHCSQSRHGSTPPPTVSQASKSARRGSSCGPIGTSFPLGYAKQVFHLHLL